jgi:transposase
MKRPQEVTLSPAEGEALIERLERETWTGADRHLVVQVLRMYFWLRCALQEAKLSLKRLRTMLFGEKAPRRTVPSSRDSSGSGGTDGSAGGDSSSGFAKGKGEAQQRPSGGHRPGQGRLGAEAYAGAAQVACRHEALRVGEVCPVCGQGRLYAVPPGVEMRLDGNALLSAIRYEIEKLRCSACGQVFTAALPEEAGEEKYSPRARAVLALGRYSLG